MNQTIHGLGKIGGLVASCVWKLPEMYTYLGIRWFALFFPGLVRWFCGGVEGIVREARDVSSRGEAGFKGR